MTSTKLNLPLPSFALQMPDLHTLEVFIEQTALSNLYDEAIAKHNEGTGAVYPDSGFDLFTPCDAYAALLEGGSLGRQPAFHASVNPTVCTDLGVRVAMHVPDGTPCGCYLYARSSTAKYPFRLANNQGIIDSGYRGTVKAMFDVDSRLASFYVPYSHPPWSPSHWETLNELSCRKEYEPYATLRAGCDQPARLTQICAPSLAPFKVRRVYSAEALGTTERGDGGIGSTGH